VQYADDHNLAARQSIYSYQRPQLDLPAAVMATIRPSGGECVADIGCGNGMYLAEMLRLGHTGPVLGIDLSPGMLTAAARRAPTARLVAGDVTALPLRSGTSDLTLAMHMLYHVPDAGQAVAELHRVTRPGGVVVIGLNGDDHLRELREPINSVLAESGAATDPVRERIRLDQGEELLTGPFGPVTRHDFTGELLLPTAQPVADYIRSLGLGLDQAEQELLVHEVTRRLAFADGSPLRVTTHCGWLIAMR
jgi:SAM-dependent methyltransferase